MEPYIADFINNSKVPKLIRCLIVIILCSFIIFIGVSLVIKSTLIFGKIFGVILVLAFLVTLIYLCFKIYKNKK